MYVPLFNIFASFVHTASRYQRSDVAGELLNSGADLNTRGICGRTSLHSTVAADAHCVIRSRGDPQTDLKPQMNDGATTPNIAARRHAFDCFNLAGKIS